MNSKYLSKSDFKIAQTCAAKLYYKKNGFPTLIDNNEYMAMLADGGYMVGLMAKLLYPDGIEITGTTQQAIAETEKLLNTNENIVLFEPAISINDQLIRIDILVKKKDRFQLIEVKSKSFNSEKWEEAEAKGKTYWESGEFQPYIEDVGFQKKVLQEKYPESKVEAYLMLPDKSKKTGIDGMIGLFSIEKEDLDSNFRKPKVNFTGTKKQLDLLRKDHILGLVNVDIYIDPLMVEISTSASTFIKSIIEDKKLTVQISCSCKGCEYKLVDGEHPVSGFDLCWKDLSKLSPHILELAQLGKINRTSNNGIGRIDDLIQKGKAGLHDVPVEFAKKDDKKPYYNNRPLYQLTKKKEFMLPEFWKAIEKIKYPLHFVDFETSQMAIPYHSGMSPYDKVIFQWSCHTITKPGGEPEHCGWLNTVDAYPNIDFAKSLKTCLGDKGAVFTWSAYENTQLKNVYDVLKTRPSHEKELSAWLESIGQFVDPSNTRIIDLNKLALSYYFHPMMGGQTSIKVTLPAVLQAAKSPRIKSWLEGEGLYEKKSDGSITNPYKLLPEPAPIYEGKQVKVRDGGGAMFAYQDMLYGISRNDEKVKQQYIEALEKYCKLDTLAMVIIWEHWMSLKKI